MSAIQEAASHAIAFAREVYGEEAVKDPRIDEVERDGFKWHITLSWTAFESFLGIPRPVRVYKQFDVGSDGDVTAMRIRNVG